MTESSLKVKGNLEILALRLPPGTDVRRDLEAIAKREQISAGVIMGAVGSLSLVKLRFANAQTPTVLVGNHEILTLSGTVSEDGIHLHMTVANAHGDCKGGHLVDGCQVNTTLELVIAVLPAVRFTRSFDPATGYLELSVFPTDLS
ncbi:MAG: PPC domain-containing DNA-binding protein [Thermosynechococcaceae cyanobacterium]